jgi:hypothetical protein
MKKGKEEKKNTLKGSNSNGCFFPRCELRGSTHLDRLQRPPRLRVQSTKPSLGSHCLTRGRHKRGRTPSYSYLTMSDFTRPITTNYENIFTDIFKVENKNNQPLPETERNEAFELNR